jgi:type II secretory pathway component PulF
MALYAYQAFSKDGKKVKGFIDASSLSSAKEQLTRQSLFPISVELAQSSSNGGFLSSLFTRKVSTKDKILFTRQLSTLLKAGIPLLQALELLIEQLEGQLRTITIAIKDNVKEGISLADALAKYPRIFETLYVQLVRAGEASGKLETILDRLADYLERSAATQKKVKSALRMPLIQLAAAIIVVAGLVIKVVPSIAEGLSGQGQELPGLTQFMMDVADFLTNYYLFIISGLIILIIIYRYWSSTTTGARTIDRIKLRLPLVKRITKTNAVVQFCYTLGMLLEGGVDLAQALDIVCAVIDNRILTDTLKEARDNIVKQGKIAQYLKQTNIFPAIAIYLIKTGEESGQLDTMLLTVARNYEEELRELIDGLTSAITPAMLLFVAGLIGLIILSIMLPILKVMEAASGGI